MSAAPVLSVSGLSVEIDGRDVVADVSLDVGAGETVAVVGESGSGKSMTAMAVMGLLPGAARIVGGSVMLDRGSAATDLLSLRPREMRRVRGGEISMIFQEPMTSLNPVLTIGEQVAEAVRAHRAIRGRAARRVAVAALESVGIERAADRFGAYPHEFSGGMRQRVMIAAALACEPRVLIADEPTTALDVTVQKQILELIERRRRETGLAVVLISHDLALVSRHVDRTAVMCGGRVVESAPTRELVASPRHPYTNGLLACVPRLGDGSRRLRPLERTEHWARPIPGDDTGSGPWWPGEPSGAWLE